MIDEPALVRPAKRRKETPMTWPTFGDVLPILTVFAAVAGFVWTLGRIFRRWMGEEARKANEALYERLKNNDFRHVEDRVAAGLEGVNERLDRTRADLEAMEGRTRADRDAMEARIGDRLSRLREDGAAMEARIMERAREDRAAILGALTAHGAPKAAEGTST